MEDHGGLLRKMPRFASMKEAISFFYNIPQNRLKKIKDAGFGGGGVYLYNDRVYKISYYWEEYVVAKRMIEKNFRNLVKIYSANKCKIVDPDNIPWNAFIIEQERLYKNRFSNLPLDLTKMGKGVTLKASYLCDVLSGLSELASIGVFHKDLHGKNIMFDQNNNPKIIDFGLVSIKRKAA